MTRFKNYSYCIVDQKVLKPSIFGLENSCLKAAFCSWVLYFHAWRSFDTENTLFFSEYTALN